MKALVKALACLSIVLAAMAFPVSAGPIGVDAGWYGFCFGGVGSPATAGCQNDGVGVSGNSTTFTALGPVDLKVTDAFDHGDQFDVFVNSLLAFTTPAVGTSSGSVTDPDIAFADPLYSHAFIALGPGSYTVDVFAAASPFGGGGAYIEVASASVPQPAAWALLSSALGLLALLRRRSAAGV